MINKVNKIKSGIIDTVTDDGEIVICSMDYEGTKHVWFENGHETISEVPLEVIKIAAEKIK